MYGLIIAFFWFLFAGGLNAFNQSGAFLSAADFLYTWYWIFGALTFIFVAIAIISSLFAGVVLGGALFGKIGVFLGVNVASYGSFMAFAKIIFKKAFLILGAYLLATAGNWDIPLASFSMFNLVMGFGMIFFVIMYDRAGRTVRR